MKTAARSALAALLAVTAAPPLGAATDPGEHWCGASKAGLEIALARHEYFARRLERERPSGIPPKSHATVRQAGDIAVIEDDGTLFVVPESFDLQGRSMQFLRRPKGLSAVRSHLDFKAVLGSRLALGDDDSVLVEFPADFRYPFGDAVYSEVWVNSDGTLTFGTPDSASTARSLARFLDGPPRIAPLFTDLDPTQAAGAGGVYLNFLPGRVRVTWYEVPEFAADNRSTVQVTLFETGRVTFVYGATVEAGRAIVGVNPFAGSAPLHLMDYDLELPFRPQRVAIAEWFPDAAPMLDQLAVSARFLQVFRDVYDQLLVWYDFPKDLGRGVLGQAVTLKNDVQGIGDDLYDFSDQAGSAGRLQALVEMAGSVLDDYPEDPDEPAFRAGESTMSLVGHEVGHRWLAEMRYRDTKTGDVETHLLGRQRLHWSFFMDSDASLLEGNEIVDNGDGTFLTQSPVAVRYNALDQYAMGLIPPRAVPDFFYVRNPVDTIFTPESNPRGGVRITGQRVDVSIADVIAAEGPRLPPASEAPKVFSVAFALVGAPGEEVSEEAIAKLDRFRRRFETYFREASGRNGRVVTELVPRGIK